jgi:hypothetical protein
MAKSDVTLLVTVSNTVLDSEPMNPNFPPSPMAAPAPAPGLAQLQAAVQGIVNVLGNVEPIVQELAAMPGQLHALQVAFGEFQEALGELRNRYECILFSDCPSPHLTSGWIESQCSCIMQLQMTKPSSTTPLTLSQGMTCLNLKGN